MRIVLAALLVVAATFSAVAAPAPNTPPGAPYPRVQGGDCTALKAKLGANAVWHTWFKGQLDTPGDSNGNLSSIYYYDDPCFASLETCKAWLYWAQTDWPDMMQFQRCREGG